MAYNHLSFEQRCTLATFWKLGYRQKAIAVEVGVSEATISREIRRNKRWTGWYSPEQAQVQYQDRRKACCRHKKIVGSLELIVNEKLNLDWSPEQISGYGKRWGLYSVSDESIYQHVLKNKLAGGNLFLHLRRSNRKYRKRFWYPRNMFPIKNRVFIDDRPKVVDEKSRVPPWTGLSNTVCLYFIIWSCWAPGSSMPGAILSNIPQ